MVQKGTGKTSMSGTCAVRYAIQMLEEANCIQDLCSGVWEGSFESIREKLTENGFDESYSDRITKFQKDVGNVFNIIILVHTPKSEENAYATVHLR